MSEGKNQDRIYKYAAKNIEQKYATAAESTKDIQSIMVQNSNNTTTDMAEATSKSQDFQIQLVNPYPTMWKPC